MARTTVVKICGLTNAEDARFALQSGADWIGLNFVAGPRQITIDVAKRILTEINDPSRAVALILVDQADGHHEQVVTLADLGIQCFQLYGDVTPAIVTRLVAQKLQVIVPRAVPDTSALEGAARFLYECADMPPSFVLLDAVSGGQLGGTGRLANWPAIAQATREGLFKDWPRLILAGGLNAQNVGTAMGELSPYGVDVSSGVESRSGRKDPAKVAAFVAAARRAP